MVLTAALDELNASDRTKIVINHLSSFAMHPAAQNSWHTSVIVPDSWQYRQGSYLFEVLKISCGSHITEQKKTGTSVYEHPLTIELHQRMNGCVFKNPSFMNERQAYKWLMCISFPFVNLSFEANLGDNFTSRHKLNKFQIYCFRSQKLRVASLGRESLNAYKFSIIHLFCCVNVPSLSESAPIEKKRINTERWK